MVAIERKAIQKKLEGTRHKFIRIFVIFAILWFNGDVLFLDYTTKNDVRNYLVQWPSDPGDEAFYIQVTIMSTIPFING